MANILLLLHAHMPYVRHPEHERFLEENWYFEATIESYVPLLEILLAIDEYAPSARVSLSASPTLMEMASDELLGKRLIAHIDSLIRLAGEEVQRTKGDPDLEPLARMYLDRYEHVRAVIKERFGGSVIAPLRELCSHSEVELLTTAATHAFLPNLAPVGRAVSAQIQLGVRAFQRHMGRRPRGFWLPECGYYEGLDRLLADEGIGYTILSSHGLLHARPRPSHGLYSPIRMPSGVLAFGREQELSMKVWSARQGYPAHPSYREFYRDIGFDLDAPHMREFLEQIVPGGSAYTGIKYHRITGGQGPKEPYHPAEAKAQAGHDAAHYAAALSKKGEEVKRMGGFTPLMVLPFDAELFGHWWFEGPHWLRAFLREVHERPDLSMVLPSEFTPDAREYQEAAPGLSSWGEGGYGSPWSDMASSGEALRTVIEESARLAHIMDTVPHDPDARAALKQAIRELLLLQASDWGFHIHRGTASAYAQARIRGHSDNLRMLCRMAESGRVDMEKVEALRARAPLFSDLSVSDYSSSLE
jgi:1,4-alpha-glucan branching enzyme